MTTAEKKALIETAKLFGLGVTCSVAGYIFIMITSVEVMIWLLLLTSLGFLLRASYTFNLARYKEELKQIDDKSL